MKFVMVIRGADKGGAWHLGARQHTDFALNQFSR